MIPSDTADAAETLELPAPARPRAEKRVSDHRVCPAAMLVEGSGPALTNETASLLRRRLQLTSWLLAGGLGSFLIYRLLHLHELQSSQGWLALAIHATTTGLLTLLGWLLRRPHAIPDRHLCSAELLVFGSCGLFFTIVSYDALQKASAEGQVGAIVPMWMTLIYTYALFIPNRWQRAAWMISLMTAIPIGMLVSLRLGALAPDSLLVEQAYLRQGPTDHCMALLITGVIGVWGVFTINTLRREAFEAKRLGQYQLRHRLGAGGMGEVYLAEHLMLKRPCAIKLIRPDRAGDPGALARFEREVRATARLTHWNSVEVFDYGHTADGTFYYVMEYLPGMNLDELVRMHGPMPSDRIIRLLTHVCHALREAHAQGLIHRDIKPANIFAAHRGGVYDVAKLLDFGLAKTVSVTPSADVTLEGSITGSPHYMSPEQALGESPDVRSDIYSLGAVAWYLAVGRPPFAEGNPMRVLFAHAHKQPERELLEATSLPTELTDLILRSLEKDPDLRPQSADEFGELLACVPPTTGWSDAQAADWWKRFGCPKKKELDEIVAAGAA